MVPAPRAENLEARIALPCFGRLRRVARAVLPLVVLCCSTSPQGLAGESKQIWGEVTLGWPTREKLYFELDFEPQFQISGDPLWRSLDVTGTVEYYPSAWIDLVGEVDASSTLETDDLRTISLSFRAGVRFHFLRNVQDEVNWERRPLGRVGVATLLRLEERNFWYSDDTPAQQDVRLRLKLELKVPLNRPNMSAERTLYLIADAEGYIPLGDEVDERYANKLRTRIGLGYRINARHRVEALYILDRVRNSADDDPSESNQALDFRYRLVF